MNIIYIGSDHRGFRTKEALKETLRKWEMNVVDLGYKEYVEDDDYTDIAIELAQKVVFERAIGILICGSGVGVCVAANKVKGAYAALCTSEKQARLAREDDNANILCLSGELIDEDLNEKIVKTFLESVFSPIETHIRRINKIKEYEETKIN
ncbi:MAG: RpiB/LacA/LacB family sugar-phosphate isomerase [Candidatus Shapirobacteria bacterium]